MSKISLLLMTLCLACNPAFGHSGNEGEHDDGSEHREKIGGVPLADFSVNELVIPCVEVENLDPNVDGQFFDVILDRRGNSMNFELKFAQVEDSSLCQATADFAKYHDDDFDDDSSGGTKILVRCERRQDRSKISVDAKNLIAGNYSAEITSGNNKANSPMQGTVDDEVEFDFDSDPEDIAKGATAIPPDFIQGGKVSAKVLNEAGQTVVEVTDIACLSR